MLQLLPQPPAQPGPAHLVPPVVDGPYECAATAQFGGRLTPALLDRTRARTSWLAVWWLQLRAQRLAEQLPTPLARPVLAWLTDDTEQDHVRRLLDLGQPYTLTVSGDGAEHRLTVKLWQPCGHVRVTVRQ
ncbi:hypothetical protein ACIOJE_35225 [Kitasatospora sp. NPDC087861]|uniref:hypothetical protein n=1 Tax=Kitasatospora sp. NPDC087861 TaxID=3364070 RepID=UPI003821BC47